MTRSRLVIGLAAAGILAIGAGCTTTTTIRTNNTNTTITAETNTSLSTNSSTTGTFDTGSNTNTATSQTTTVTVTSGGVQPSTVTVTKGTTVTFINNDTQGHQIASNPHPTHTDLPGFDSLSGIQPGGQYAFTFTAAGTFGYHDHLNPFSTKFQGQVIVQ